MNNKQENKFTRNENVQEVMEDNSAIVGTVPKLQEETNELIVLNTAIKAKDSERLGVTTGKTLNKADARNELTDIAMAACGSLFALGKNTNRNELIELGKTSRTVFDKMRDTQVLTFCGNINNVVITNSADLGDYGFGAAKQAEFPVKLTAYNDALSEKEGAFSSHKGMTSSLEELFESADDKIEIIMKLSEVLRADQPEFLSTLEAANVIRNLGEESGVYVGVLRESETDNIISNGIEMTTRFKITNRGVNELQVFMSGDEAPGEGGVILTGGQELMVTGADLGPAGSTHLNITNKSDTTEGKYRIKKYKFD